MPSSPSSLPIRSSPNSSPSPTQFSQSRKVLLYPPLSLKISISNQYVHTVQHGWAQTHTIYTHTCMHQDSQSFPQTHTNTPGEREEVNITLLSRMQKKFMLLLEKGVKHLVWAQMSNYPFAHRDKKEPFFWERASHQYFSLQPQEYSNICTKWANFDLSLGRNVLFLLWLFLPLLISMAPSKNVLFGRIKVRPEKVFEGSVFRCYCALHAYKVHYVWWLLHFKSLALELIWFMVPAY